MIDTTDPTAIELALTYCQGTRFLLDQSRGWRRKISNASGHCADLARRVVVGCIDED